MPKNQHLKRFLDWLHRVLRKIVVWAGSFAFGAAPAALFAGVLPWPWVMPTIAEKALQAGVFREFLFLPLSVSGVAVLSGLDSFISLIVSKTIPNKWSALGVFVLLAGLVVMIGLIGHAMSQIQPGVTQPPSLFEAYVLMAQVAVFASLGLEVIVTLNMRSGDQHSDEDGSEGPPLAEGADPESENG